MNADATAVFLAFAVPIIGAAVAYFIRLNTKLNSLVTSVAVITERQSNTAEKIDDLAKESAKHSGQLARLNGKIST